MCFKIISAPFIKIRYKKNPDFRQSFSILSDLDWMEFSEGFQRIYWLCSAFFVIESEFFFHYVDINCQNKTQMDTKTATIFG